MPVSFTNSATSDTGTPSVSASIPAGTVYLVVLWATGLITTDQSTTQIAVGGSSAGFSSLGIVNGSTANWASAGVFVKSNPPTGTQTIAFTPSVGGQSSFFAIGFDTFDSVSAFFSANGNIVANGNFSETVTLTGIAAGDIICSVQSDDCGTGGGTRVSQTGTVIANFDTGGGTDSYEGGQYQTAAGTSEAATWVMNETNGGSGDWCICAVAVRSPAAGNALARMYGPDAQRMNSLLRR